MFFLSNFESPTVGALVVHLAHPVPTPLVTNRFKEKVTGYGAVVEKKHWFNQAISYLLFRYFYVCIELKYFFYYCRWILLLRMHIIYYKLSVTLGTSLHVQSIVQWFFCEFQTRVIPLRFKQTTISELYELRQSR